MALRELFDSRVALIDERGRRILGRWTGPAMPFGPDETSSLGPKDDVQVIATSMYNILATPKGTVPYNPALGSYIPLLLHEPLDDVTLGLIRHYVVKDVSEQEPRVRVHSVITSREGEYGVSVAISFSLVGDSLGRILNAPLIFRREAI